MEGAYKRFQFSSLYVENMLKISNGNNKILKMRRNVENKIYARKHDKRLEWDAGYLFLWLYECVQLFITYI